MGCAGGIFTLRITIPANTTATVHLPARSPDGVKESGAPVALSPGVSFVSAAGDRAGTNHGDSRGETARHARLRHHEANRVLEDEGEEDADEDDEEGVADRCECDGEAERPEHEEHRPHREE